MKAIEYKGFYITHYLVVAHISDVRRRRLINNILHEYLYQQEASCFEGELSPAQMFELKSKLKRIIDKKKDVTIIYPLAKQNIFAKEVIGRLRYKITRIF